MKEQNRRYLFILAIVILVCCHPTLLSADPDGYEPANTLPWPVLDQETDQPRQGIWSGMGEYQNYTGYIPWFHSGSDIRGVYLDTIVVVDDGNIWMVANLEQGNAGPTEGSSCRLYLLSSDQRYIYYYSHLFLGPETDYTSTARAQIENASPQGASQYTVNPNTDVSAGDTLAFIANFPSWNHLHFGIIDAEENYDMLNPLTAFASIPVDDEPPEIQSLEFYASGISEALNSPQPITPEGTCQVISGDLDIVADIEDTFYTTGPAPPDLTGGATSISIYEARYIIREITSPTPAVDKTWYRFDRMPLSCATIPRGTGCPTITEPLFFDATIDRPNGAAHYGEDYASILYSDGLSNSNYSTNEIYAHILTNSWGVDDSWDTTTMADGMYQVSVEAMDLAGNKSAYSEFVYVHNGSGSVNPNQTPPDAYVRDNPEDVGALPSTLGGLPFWTSPDIVVVPQGGLVAAGPDFAGSSQVTAGTTYDVYIRIHNDLCNEVKKVKAKVYSANPSMILDTGDWNTITGGNFVGDSSHPNGVTVPAGGTVMLGPLTWTPTDDEANSNNGHRCMLAYITSDDDPYTAFPDVVKDNNNIAQRNMQVEGSSSFSIVNPGENRAMITIIFDCNTMPIYEKGSVVRLSVEYNGILADAWAKIPGTELTYSPKEKLLHLDIFTCHIVFPTVVLPGKTVIPAFVTLRLPPEQKGVYAVHFSEEVNGVLRGGMSFEVKN
jgi:hypothetical protein